MQQWLCLETGLDAEQLSARSSSDCAPETWGLCDCTACVPSPGYLWEHQKFSMSLAFFCFVLASISSRPETLSSE